MPRPMALEKAMEQAEMLVEDAARLTVEIFLSGRDRAGR
jgi:hypothetical protein